MKKILLFLSLLAIAYAFSAYSEEESVYSPGSWDKAPNFKLLSEYALMDREISYIPAKEYELGSLKAELPVFELLVENWDNEDIRSGLGRAIADWPVFARSYAHNYITQNGHLVNSQKCQKVDLSNWWDILSEEQKAFSSRCYESTRGWIIWDFLIPGVAKTSYADVVCNSLGKKLSAPLGVGAGWSGAMGPLGNIPDPFRAQGIKGYTTKKTGIGQIAYLQMCLGRKITKKGGRFHIGEVIPEWNLGWGTKERMAWCLPQFHLIVPGKGALDLAPIAQHLSGSGLGNIPRIDQGGLVMDNNLIGVSVNNGQHSGYYSFSNVKGQNHFISYGMKTPPEYRGVGYEICFWVEVKNSGNYDLALNVIRRKKVQPNYHLVSHLYSKGANSFVGFVSDNCRETENIPKSRGLYLEAGWYLVIVDQGPVDLNGGLVNSLMPPFRWSLKKMSPL